MTSDITPVQVKAPKFTKEEDELQTNKVFWVFYLVLYNIIIAVY